MIEINGKHYLLWSKFVERKNEWIGGILEDLDGCPPTKITDIELIPNGKDSAFFRVKGEDYDCGFDVKYGGVDGRGEKRWLTFSGYGGHFWRIKSVQPVNAVDCSHKAAQLAYAVVRL